MGLFITQVEYLVIKSGNGDKDVKVVRQTGDKKNKMNVFLLLKKKSKFIEGNWRAGSWYVCDP